MYNIQESIDAFMADVDRALRQELGQTDPETLKLVFRHFRRRMVSKMANELRVVRQGFKTAGKIKALRSNLPEKLARLRDRSVRCTGSEVKYPDSELGERTVYLITFPEGLKPGAYRDLLKRNGLQMLDPLAFLDFLGQSSVSGKEPICSYWHVGSQVYSMIFDPVNLVLRTSSAQAPERKDSWYICEPII